MYQTVPSFPPGTTLVKGLRRKFCPLFLAAARGQGRREGKEGTRQACPPGPYPTWLFGKCPRQGDCTPSDLGFRWELSARGLCSLAPERVKRPSLGRRGAGAGPGAIFTGPLVPWVQIVENRVQGLPGPPGGVSE